MQIAEITLLPCALAMHISKPATASACYNTAGLLAWSLCSWPCISMYDKLELVITRGALLMILCVAKMMMVCVP